MREAVAVVAEARESVRLRRFLETGTDREWSLFFTSFLLAWILAWILLLCFLIFSSFWFVSFMPFRFLSFSTLLFVSALGQADRAVDM